MVRTTQLAEGDEVTFEDQDGSQRGIVERVLEGSVYLVNTGETTKGVHADAIHATAARSSGQE